MTCNEAKSPGTRPQLLISVGIAVVLIVLGGAGVYMALLRPLLAWAEMGRWVQTGCFIRAAEVTTRTDPGGDSAYGIKLLYSYDVEGIVYNGKAFGRFGLQLQDRAAVQSYLSKLTPRSEVPCYYNPQRPAQCVISRQWHSMNNDLLGLVPGGVMLFGLFLLARRLWSLRDRP